MPETITLFLDSPVTLVFKNKKQSTKELKTTLRQMLESDIDHFNESLEDSCSCASCNNESQNFCDCGPLFEDFSIQSIKIGMTEEKSKMKHKDQSILHEFIPSSDPTICICGKNVNLHPSYHE